MCAGNSGCAVGTGGRGQCLPRRLEHTLPTGWCFHPGRYENNHGRCRCHPGAWPGRGLCPGPSLSLVPPWGTPNRLRCVPFWAALPAPGEGHGPCGDRPAPSPPKPALWGGGRLPPFASPRKRVSGLTRRHQDFVLSPVH